MNSSPFSPFYGQVIFYSEDHALYCVSSFYGSSLYVYRAVYGVSTIYFVIENEDIPKEAYILPI